MTLDELKQKVEAAEADLSSKPYVVLHTFERNDRALHLAITDRLRRACRNGKVWKSRAMLTVLKNAEYGFDEQLARSTGGRDGIFLLDRDYKPPNEMIRKLFDRYIDKDESGFDSVLAELGASRDQIKAVRLVSHHMRLLGVLWQAAEADWLVLVDYDQS